MKPILWPHETLVFPSERTFVLPLGAEYIHSDLQSMENLELSAIMSFTWFIVTYASIITCDTSNGFYNPTSKTYAMFSYPRTQNKAN